MNPEADIISFPIFSREHGDSISKVIIEADGISLKGLYHSIEGVLSLEAELHSTISPLQKICLGGLRSHDIGRVGDFDIKSAIRDSLAAVLESYDRLPGEDQLSLFDVE